MFALMKVANMKKSLQKQKRNKNQSSGNFAGAFCLLKTAYTGRLKWIL